MKYLVLIALLIVVGVAGYWIGSNRMATEPENTTEVVGQTDATDNNNENRDKSEEKENENLSNSGDEEDTLTDLLGLDTLSEVILPRDTTFDDEELFIKRDELIGARRIPITYLENPVENDSLIKERLGIKSGQPKDIMVQFWQSPIGYMGYKLSKSTLILYGLSDQIKFKIYYKNQQHYLSGEEIFYALKETNDFLPFQEVKKSTVLND